MVKIHDFFVKNKIEIYFKKHLEIIYGIAHISVS